LRQEFIGSDNLIRTNVSRHLSGKNDSTYPVVRVSRPDEAAAWDRFVMSHPKAGVYHLFGWQQVISKAYNHKTYYLVAIRSEAQKNGNDADIIGILPLVHLKHFIFGNYLISIPFFDSGGVLANNETTARALLEYALNLGKELKATCIEMRHSEPLAFKHENKHVPTCQSPGNSGIQQASSTAKDTIRGTRVTTKSHRVRMVLELPGSSEILMKSFKAKLRSQIKKPLKEGLHAKVGGVELLNDFYSVFSENMRDLGSPVHSKELIGSALTVFSDIARIVIVYSQNEPLACSVAIGFKQTLSNPWASALRKFSAMSPNMLLYWTMLEYACQEGFTQFDFGRSSPKEGTYKFKKQWGAQPHAFHWQYFWLNGSAEEQSVDKSHFTKMIEYWKKLPVPVTRVFGPMIRKHIGL